MQTALRDDAMDEVKKLRFVQLAADAQANLTKQANSVLESGKAGVSWSVCQTSRKLLFQQ